MPLALYFRHIPDIFKTHSAIFILCQALRTLAYLGTFRFSHTQVYSKRCTAESIFQDSRSIRALACLGRLCFTYVQAYSQNYTYRGTFAHIGIEIGSR